jgi:ADP-glucose pyrophosphorylase
VPKYSFFEASAPIYTHPRFLPGSKINGATLRQAIISDGCIISDAHIERSVIGVRSLIRSGATIRNSVIMGGDYFEVSAPEGSPDLPAIGIGRNCVIDRAIIDKNARIGDGVVITPEGKEPNLDAANYFIRDGIVLVPKTPSFRPVFGSERGPSLTTRARWFHSAKVMSDLLAAVDVPNASPGEMRQSRKLLCRTLPRRITPA